jgi:hypothetical protein
MTLLLATVLAAACDTVATRQPPPARSSAAPASGAIPRKWYPIADAAVALPLGCSASCTLDCDVWSGTIECSSGVGPITVWGGLNSMAGMSLDESGANVEGRERLPDGGLLRWGTATEGKFCVTTAGPKMPIAAGHQGYWTWQYCAPDSLSRRPVILSIGRSYRKGPLPPEDVIECENRGC